MVNHYAVGAGELVQLDDDRLTPLERGANMVLFVFLVVYVVQAVLR